MRLYVFYNYNGYGSDLYELLNGNINFRFYLFHGSLTNGYREVFNNSNNNYYIDFPYGTFTFNFRTYFL